MYAIFDGTLSKYDDRAFSFKLTISSGLRIEKGSTVTLASKL